MTKVFYRRNLPHWLPEGKSLFVTWRLAGSLPQGSEDFTTAQARAPVIRRPGDRFRAFDSELYQAKTGPLWLADARIASIVVDSLKRGEALGHYALHTFVVMPNHVHILITPHLAVERITRAIKGTTSRRSNQLLGRVGSSFWQDESFDHWVRNQEEFIKIRTYIEHNPVSAGLVTRPEDWRWSNAGLP